MPPPAPLAGREEFYSPCVPAGLWGFLGRARSVIQNHTQEEPSSASCSQSAAVPLSHLKGLCAGALIAQTGKVSCACLREANFSHFTPYFSLERCWSQHSASSRSGRFVSPAAPKGAALARTGMLLLVCGSRAKNPAQSLDLCRQSHPRCLQIPAAHGGRAFTTPCVGITGRFKFS